MVLLSLRSVMAQWCYHLPFIIQLNVVPIPGSRRAAHMETNAKAVDLELQSDELAEVARIVADGAAGARASSDYLNRVEM
jgi:diketogulonate reductase-like aldo/keto reductase